ncbi:MAG: response regulator transcription factor [Pseudobdellovibrionaceae bacterium]
MIERKKLLILEDDHRMRDLLSQGLSSDFEVIATDTIEDAQMITNKSTPDIFLLDIHLKTGSGIDFCHKLRYNQLTKKLPILVLTGFGNSEKMLRTYDVGADDYLEKPIDLTILRNRLKARLKRFQDVSHEGQRYSNLKLHSDRNEIEVNGEIRTLSPTEFEILQIFLSNPNKKISRKEILQSVWTEVRVEERTVDVHVSSLRRKLKGFDYTLKALYGSGYILRSSNK